MIDYVITDWRGREEIDRMEMGDKVDSTHFPLIVDVIAGV